MLETTVQNDLHQAIDIILAENRAVLGAINSTQIAQLIEAITHAKRIFVAGEGRSGLVLRMFAMRLMHLGCQGFVVGETTTPSIQPGDILIDCSGSGSTETVKMIAQKAKAIGVRIISITTQPNSALGQLADIVIHLNAAAKQDHTGQHSQQFAGSLFEQSSLLLLDAVFYLMATRSHLSSATLYSLHANLE